MAHNGDFYTRSLRYASFSATADGPKATDLSVSQQQVLQVVVLISCSISFIGICFVLLHYGWNFCSATLCWRRRHHRHPHTLSATASSSSAPSSSIARDFNSQLVFVLSCIDLVSILARMSGRTLLDHYDLCQFQAAIIHAAGLAGCLWTTCMSFNLYRWIVFGESDKKRRSRLWPFILFTFLPSTLLTMYPLRANKYGNATFYCWLMDPPLMFLHFYVYYVLLAVVNIVLLLAIRSTLKQRTQWHDSASADVTSAMIRRKALLYILIFLVHRTPIFIYRIIQCTTGVQIFAMGMAVQFILNLDGFSNAVVYGGLFRKMPSAHPSNSENDPWRQLRSSNSDNDAVGSGSMDTDDLFSKRFKNNGTLSMVPEELCERMTDVTTSNVTQPSGSTPRSLVDSGIRSFVFNAAASQQPTDTHHVSKKRRFAAGILDRASPDLGSTKRPMPQAHPTKPSQSFSIFTSTFNMAEQNVSPSELADWIPIGHEIYVIGVQECMNLSDLQTKILQHLIANTKSKYIHYSREIGKRATALGYHGYIALTVFVLEEAIFEGRFEMPHRDAMSKHAQEVYRGKSLLLFGRASNKGAVGISFRYGNTSFAFVTCHLASDSSGKKLTFRGNKPPISSEDNRFSDLSPGAFPQATVKHLPSKTPPSKVERRNQDAMEILQQLYLDEEDYGFGFPLLHHHSFVLGDLNYRMTRKGSTPVQMLDLLTHVGQCKSTATTARSSSNVSAGSDHRLSSSSAGFKPKAFDVYEELATPTMMRLLPDLPLALNTLIRDHDELTALREASQLFHGFEEAPITFFPTFRRIRGELLRSYDSESLAANYSLVASGGGYRVPSYTDRILYTSLPGRQQQVQCLYYDSCEAVTSSDHKPVCAVFRVGAVIDDEVDVIPPSPAPPQRSMSRMSCIFGSAPVLRRKNSSDSTCDVKLKVDFCSIQWLDAMDNGTGSSLFSRLENVELGFLFPLPCEDILSHQRKLQQVAEHLNWGESIETATPLPSAAVSGSPSASSASSSIVTASPNFHLMPWNKFVEQGLRYNTRIAPSGKKHVALMIRTRSRGKTRTASASRSRSRSGSASSTSMGGGGGNASTSFTSSSSVEFSLGHGTFCIDKVGKRQASVVPLTLGGNLVAHLHLRVTLQLRAN